MQVEICIVHMFVPELKKIKLKFTNELLGQIKVLKLFSRAKDFDISFHLSVGNKMKIY